MLLAALMHLLSAFITRFFFFLISKHKNDTPKANKRKKRIENFYRFLTYDGAPGLPATQSAFQTRITRTRLNSYANLKGPIFLLFKVPYFEGATGSLVTQERPQTVNFKIARS